MNRRALLDLWNMRPTAAGLADTLDRLADKAGDSLVEVSGRYLRYAAAVVRESAWTPCSEHQPWQSGAYLVAAKRLDFPGTATGEARWEAAHARWTGPTGADLVAEPTHWRLLPSGP